MLKHSATGSAFLQKIAVFYIIIWTLAPFMEIDTLWRGLALGCTLVWFAFELRGSFRLGRAQLYAIIFALAVVLVAYLETGTAKGIIRQIPLYVMVICFLMCYFYRNRWRELSGMIPLVLILLTVFNVRSMQAVAVEPGLARLLVRNDEAIYGYLRRGIGGYSLIYPQVVIFPAILAWIRKTFRRHNVLFALGLVWLASYVSFLAIAGYATAIVASLIGLVMLYFYRGRRVLPAFFIALLLFLFGIWMIVYYETFRNFLLTIFDGTAVAKKINDLVASAQEGAAEGSIYDRILAYRYSLETILHYPVIGSLWHASGGGHSAILDVFAKYGVLGGYVYVSTLFSVPNYYKNRYLGTDVMTVANATMVTLLFVSILDSVTYAFYGMIFIVLPLLLEDILKWSGRKYENSLDSQSDSRRVGTPAEN